jgi:hypothetical protein
MEGREYHRPPLGETSECIVGDQRLALSSPSNKLPGASALEIRKRTRQAGSMAPPDRRIAVMSQCLINLHVSRKSVLPPTPPKTRSWWLAAS